MYKLSVFMIPILFSQLSVQLLQPGPQSKPFLQQEHWLVLQPPLQLQ